MSKTDSASEVPSWLEHFTSIEVFETETRILIWRAKYYNPFRRLFVAFMLRTCSFVIIDVILDVCKYFYGTKERFFYRTSKSSTEKSQRFNIHLRFYANLSKMNISIGC